MSIQAYNWSLELKGRHGSYDKSIIYNLKINNTFHNVLLQYVVTIKRDKILTEKRKTHRLRNSYLGKSFNRKKLYRGSPHRTIFVLPGNRTMGTDLVLKPKFMTWIFIAPYSICRKRLVKGIFCWNILSLCIRKIVDTSSS